MPARANIRTDHRERRIGQGADVDVDGLAGIGTDLKGLLAERAGEHGNAVEFGLRGNALNFAGQLAKFSISDLFRGRWRCRCRWQTGRPVRACD